MDTPKLIDPIQVAPDTHSISVYLPIPTLGVLPVNAFVIHAEQPVLIDTGVLALQGPFLDQLSSVIAPEALRWIWLTHTDADHIGALRPLLDAAPNARVVTTFLGLGKLGLHGQWPQERFYLLNPGQTLDVGDRTLAATRPPVFDAPETTAVFDEKTRAYFSADAFGALLSEPAPAAEAVDPGRLREGLVTWTTIDAPWLADVDPAAVRRNLAAVQSLEPSVVLSAHLPPARGITTALLDGVVEASTASPFVGPDQQALMALAGA